MPEEVTAKIIIEESGSGGRSSASPAKTRERDQTQKDISKNLKGIAGFFGGGQGALLTTGLVKLGALIGPLGILGTAVAGIAAYMGSEPVSQGLSGVIESQTDDEIKNREELNKEIEEGNVTVKTFNKSVEDVSDNAGDVGESLKDAWQNIKDGDWDGAMSNLGKFTGNLFDAVRGLSDLNRALSKIDSGSSDRGGGRSYDIGGFSPATPDHQAPISPGGLLATTMLPAPMDDSVLSSDLYSSKLPFISKNVGSPGSSLFYF